MPVDWAFAEHTEAWTIPNINVESRLRLENRTMAKTLSRNHSPSIIWLSEFRERWQKSKNNKKPAISSGF
jgi:hypothetical protein